MLLRCLRSRESFTGEKDPRALIDLEFSTRLGGLKEPDHELSVYRVAPEEWLTFALCHAAAALSDPPSFVRAVDTEPARADAVLAAIPDAQFPRRGAAHHEYQFDDDNDLLAFVEALVAAVNDQRSQLFYASKKEMGAHLERQRDSTPEWSTFLGKPGKDRWAKLAGPKPVPPG